MSLAWYIISNVKLIVQTARIRPATRQGQMIWFLFHLLSQVQGCLFGDQVWGFIPLIPVIYFVALHLCTLLWWMNTVFVFTELTPPSPPGPSTWPVGPDTQTMALLENKLWRLLRLQEPDRCTAGCRVARRDEYRCIADRYHNHTSPLLSLTYWIKHLPSCLWITHHPKIWRDDGFFFECLWDEWGNLRKVDNDTQQIRSPKLFLSPASPNRPDQLLSQDAEASRFIVEMCHLTQNNL